MHLIVQQCTNTWTQAMRHFCFHLRKSGSSAMLLTLRVRRNQMFMYNTVIVPVNDSDPSITLWCPQTGFAVTLSSLQCGISDDTMVYKMQIKHFLKLPFICCEVKQCASLTKRLALRTHFCFADETTRHKSPPCMTRHFGCGEAVHVCTAWSCILVLKDQVLCSLVRVQVFALSHW